MSATGLAILGAGISATSGLTDSLVKWKSQKDINDTNINLTMNQWARDDNAVQRRVKDLIAAGLSPTLAAGSAASSSSAIRLDSPAKDFKSNLGDAVIQGMTLKQMQTQIENTEATTNNTNEDTNNKKLNGQLLSEQYIKLQKENLLLDFQADLQKLNIVGQGLTNQERMKAIQNLQRDYEIKGLEIDKRKLDIDLQKFTNNATMYDQSLNQELTGRYGGFDSILMKEIGDISSPIWSEVKELGQRINQLLHKRK